ncbi:hypothetical protein [Robertkochia flava]|uniref:hypothetical protein n=1 Tax=Robertkochia flava TaxID=3447986 RepID=UPI001CCB4AB8|nr:hypothetical protein [Robertkochia marina]
MKTFNLNRLFTLLCIAGLLLSCSNDDVDDLTGTPPTPRNLNEPLNDAPTPVDLSFTANLNSLSQDQGCGGGNFLFQHSGQGSSAVLGNYSVDISYCGVPQTAGISGIEIIIEDASGNQLFLREKDENASNDNEGNSFVNNSGVTDTNFPGNGVLNEDNDLLQLEITGGTGQYSSAEGSFTTRLGTGFQAGASMTRFSLNGIISGI